MPSNEDWITSCKWSADSLRLKFGEFGSGKVKASVLAHIAKDHNDSIESIRRHYEQRQETTKDLGSETPPTREPSDTERLDWLERHNRKPDQTATVINKDGKYFHGQDFREAIDAAMCVREKKKKWPHQRRRSER